MPRPWTRVVSQLARRMTTLLVRPVGTRVGGAAPHLIGTEAPAHFDPDLGNGGSCRADSNAGPCENPIHRTVVKQPVGFNNT